VEVALEFAPATLVSSINNMVTVAGVADVALEADDLGVPGARGVQAPSPVLEMMDSPLPAARLGPAASVPPPVVGPGVS
jgi:hypothetical protein